MTTPSSSLHSPATAESPADELRRRIKVAISDFIKGRREARLEVYERRAGRLVRR